MQQSNETAAQSDSHQKMLHINKQGHVSYEINR